MHCPKKAGLDNKGLANVISDIRQTLCRHDICAHGRRCGHHCIKKCHCVLITFSVTCRQIMHVGTSGLHSQMKASNITTRFEVYTPNTHSRMPSGVLLCGRCSLGTLAQTYKQPARDLRENIALRQTLVLTASQPTRGRLGIGA